MRELRKEEMIKIDGGGNGITITAVVIGVITFVIGILHGYANPKSCNQ